MALAHPRQILGIFIRDVTIPLLSRDSGNSTSTMSLPAYFNDNGQPSQSTDPQIARLKPLPKPSRMKSQDTLSTLGTISSTPSDDDECIPPREFEKLALKEIEPLTSLYLTAFEADESPITEDLPLRQTKTPPPLLTRPPLSSRPSSASVNSEPATVKPMSLSPTPSQNTLIEEPTASSRIKRVEQWKKRLAVAREKLLVNECGVEIWTWRVGQDVEKVCETLILKELRRGEGERSFHGFGNGNEWDTPNTSVLV